MTSQKCSRIRESKTYHISQILVLIIFAFLIHIAYTYDRISICIYQMYHEILFKVLKSIRQQSST